MTDFQIHLIETPEEMRLVEQLQRDVWPGSETDVVPLHMLITAVHHAGLVALTHTPAPMKFLNQILKRPEHETPYLILVVGYPAEGATVPNIARKPWEQVATFLE